jgi:glycosyltransferase involved in cell wall biosynthesis
MDTEHPTVSVIIPAHNAAAFIAATLESVLQQTYQDFEVVVVDDGSTDQTAAIVQGVGHKVRYLHQANAGPSAARNTALRAARGQIIAFLDADDAWMPELMEQQVGVLAARPDIDGVFAWAQFMDQHGRPLPDTLRARVEGITAPRILTGGTPVQFSTMAVRKRLFDRIGLFDPVLRQSEDWDVMLRMVLAGARFACIPRTLIWRRVHPDSLTADPDDALRWARLARQKAFTTLPLPADCQALAPIATFRIVQRAALGYWRRGARGTAVERFLEAFDAWPEALRRPQTYVGIISRLVPSGYRSQDAILVALDRLADEATVLMREILGRPDLPTAIRTRRRAAWGAFHAALAYLFARRGRWVAALGHAGRAVVLSPVAPLRGAAAFASRAAAAVARR